MSAVLGYAEVAKKMGVEPSSVVAYRSRDETFPEPVTPPTFRSPGFDEVEINRWLALREASKKGRAGRPSRMLMDERIALSEQETVALKDRAKEAGISNAELSRAAGISDTALWFRYKGRSRWRRSELEAIADVLDTSIDVLRADEAASPELKAVSMTEAPPARVRAPRPPVTKKR